MSNRLRTVGTGGRQPTTILDIAEDLHLSKTTVSRALSGKGRVSAETRGRVNEYIKKNGYRPNLVAKSLAVSRTFNIGVALPTDAEANEIPFFQVCLHGITEAANARDYDIVLNVMTQRDISSLKRMVRNKKVDAVIITRLVSDDKAVAFLQESGLPFALIGTSDEASIVQVDCDHAAGCREVTAHALGDGGRRVALLAGDPRHHVNKDRYSGFLAAYRELGEAPDQRSIFWDVTNAASVDRAMGSLMGRRPDCVLCMDDVICSLALSWLARHRVEVPRDLRIASFHDSTLLEAHDPSITALHVDVAALGAAAANVLVDRLEGKAVSAKIRLGYEFIIRDSSRPR